MLENLPGTQPVTVGGDKGFDTQGFVAYVSPGLTVQIRHHLQLYGLLQVPVYSNLGGYQLFPHWAGTVGISYGM